MRSQQYQYSSSPRKINAKHVNAFGTNLDVGILQVRVVANGL